MIGAIIGDIIGSTYEFHNTRDYGFQLFPNGSTFTDDTICTIAIADAILRGIPYRDSLIEWGRRYCKRQAMFGAAFSAWLNSDNPQPYDSFGNGSAMRVSPIGWAFNSPDIVISEAKESAMCSHSHSEGIKGAQAISLAIYWLRHVKPDNHLTAKAVAKNVLTDYYGDGFFDNLPKYGEWNTSCQGCVPLALYLFSLSADFEDAIRLAVSYGGDSDTLAAIVGSLAGAFYKIPSAIQGKALSYLPVEIIEVIGRFEQKYK